MTDTSNTGPGNAPSFDQVIAPADNIPTEQTVTPVTELGNIIGSAKARRIVYGVFAAAAIAVGGAEAYYLGVHEAIPRIVIGAQAVIVYLGIPTIGVAIANTPR
jgi:hypothetical protein